MSQGRPDGPGFSAVVVIHDSEPDLIRLLASIDEHLSRPPRLIVVDNASSDGGADAARSWGAQVIRCPENLGFGAANNLGLERVVDDVTVLLNPDVELLDDGLAKLAERVARVEPALWVPRLLEADGRVQDSAHRRPGTTASLLPALIPSALLIGALRRRADPWRSRGPRRVGWAIAACMAARTSLLRRLGPFDGTDFLFYEDLDLCLRARSAGAPTMLDPRIAVRHRGAHATHRRYGGEPHELLARRRREVIARRLGSRAVRVDDLAQALTFTTRAAGRLALGRDASLQRERLRALRRARSRPGPQKSPS